MRCHPAGKHSIFQHLLCLIRNKRKQWQIPCRPILQVLKDDQIHNSAWPPAVTILCYEGLSEHPGPAQNTKAQTEGSVCSPPKHLLYLRACESLPSIPLTQGASQATGCGLGMCKSRAITASWTGITFFNITIHFAILFLCKLKNTPGWISAAVLFVWQDAGAIYCSAHHDWILRHLSGGTSPLLNLMGQKHTILARNIPLVAGKKLAKLSSSQFLQQAVFKFIGEKISPVN